MKKLVVLSFLILFANLLYSAGNGNDIPLVKGKVVFTDTIETLLNKDAIRLRLDLWADEYSVGRTNSVNVKDTSLNVMEYTFVDYLEMEKTPIRIYSIYMKYTVRLLYKDNMCMIRVNRISYIEPEDVGDKNRLSTSSISAEQVLLGKYKVGLIEDAQGKIKLHTLKVIDNLYKSLNTAIIN